MINDIFSVFGNTLNELTGARQMQREAQNFAKWQMGNSHQMEVKDLIKAGLNPVLSAGGSGATAGGVGAAPTSGVDPITMASQIVGMLNSTKQVENETDRLNADIGKINADITNETNRTNADINNQTRLTDADIELKLKEAGWTQKQIEHYKKYGVPMGANITKTYGGGGSGSFGNKFFKGSGSMNYNKSTTIPIGYKYYNSGGNVYISDSQLSQGKGKYASGKVNSTRTIIRKTSRSR